MEGQYTLLGDHVGGCSGVCICCRTCVLLWWIFLYLLLGDDVGLVMFVGACNNCWCSFWLLYSKCSFCCCYIVLFKGLVWLLDGGLVSLLYGFYLWFYLVVGDCGTFVFCLLHWQHFCYLVEYVCEFYLFFVVFCPVCNGAFCVETFCNCICLVYVGIVMDCCLK